MRRADYHNYYDDHASSSFTSSTSPANKSSDKKSPNYLISNLTRYDSKLKLSATQRSVAKNIPTLCTPSMICHLFKWDSSRSSDGEVEERRDFLNKGDLISTISALRVINNQPSLFSQF